MNKNKFISYLCSFLRYFRDWMILAFRWDKRTRKWLAGVFEKGLLFLHWSPFPPIVRGWRPNSRKNIRFHNVSKDTQHKTNIVKITINFTFNKNTILSTLAININAIDVGARAFSRLPSLNQLRRGDWKVGTW